MVTVNGEKFDAAGKTVKAYLEEAGYDMKRVAVEKNGEIVPKSMYEDTVFEDGDTAEIVTFVGGG